MEMIQIESEMGYWITLIGGSAIIGVLNGYVLNGIPMMVSAALLGILWATIVIRLTDESVLF